MPPLPLFSRTLPLLFPSLMTSERPPPRFKGRLLWQMVESLLEADAASAQAVSNFSHSLAHKVCAAVCG